MSLFLGFPPLDGVSNDQLLIPFRAKTTIKVIAEADSPPTYRIYSPAGALMTSGAGVLSGRNSGSITGAANNGSGLVRITASGHGLQTGDRIINAGIGGTTEANGTFTVTYVDANHFDLVGSTFTNAYTSGGTWTLLGYYYARVSLPSASSYERGKTYTVAVTSIVSSNAIPELYTFTVS